MSRPPLRYRIADWCATRGRQIGAAWDSVIGPIENLIGRAGEGVLSAFDSFEGLESFVVQTVRIVLWPLIFFGRLVGRFLPSGTGRGPLYVIGRFLGRTGAAIYGLAERLNLDGVLVFLATISKPLWLPIASLLGFANAWLATRRPHELLLAAPALVFALPFAFVAVHGAMIGKEDIAERYKIAVRDAANAGDYAMVELFERKLAQLGIDTRCTDYRTALKLADDGDLQEAYMRMQRLATLDSPGYAPAHLWIARHLASGRVDVAGAPSDSTDRLASLALAEQHLEQLVKLDIASDGIALLRAYVLASTGRMVTAIELLEPYSDNPGPAAVLRLRLLTQVRDLTAARDQARVVLEMAADRKWRDTARTDDFESWALAAEVLGEEDQLEAALSAWLMSRPDDQEPRKLLSKHRREEAEQLLNSPTTAPAKTATIIVEAIRLGAPDTWTNALIGRIVQDRTTSRYVERVWDELSSSDATPEPLTTAMATIAAARGDIVSARAAFQRAVEHENAKAVVWNNYAWTLLQEPNPDPQAALEAVGRALDLAPDDFRFRETRGQALLALGRWEDAIADLEYALNGLPDAVDVHRSLAKAYEATAQPQLAEVHRRQAGF